MVFTLSTVMRFALIWLRNMAKTTFCIQKIWSNVLWSILVFTTIQGIYSVDFVSCSNRFSIINQLNCHNRKSNIYDHNGKLWKISCRTASICAVKHWPLPISVALQQFRRSMRSLPLTPKNIQNLRNGLNVCPSCHTMRRKMVLAHDLSKKCSEKYTRKTSKRQRNNEKKNWLIRHKFPFIHLPQWTVYSLCTWSAIIFQF